MKDPSERLIKKLAVKKKPATILNRIGQVLGYKLILIMSVVTVMTCVTTVVILVKYKELATLEFSLKNGGIKVIFHPKNESITKDTVNN